MLSLKVKLSDTKWLLTPQEGCILIFLSVVVCPWPSYPAVSTVSVCWPSSCSSFKSGHLVASSAACCIIWVHARKTEKVKSRVFLCSTFFFTRNLPSTKNTFNWNQLHIYDNVDSCNIPTAPRHNFFTSGYLMFCIITFRVPALLLLGNSIYTFISY